MTLRIAIAALVLFPLAAAPAVAETLAPPTVEYQGQLRIEAGRLVLSGRVRLAGGKERRSLKLHGSRIPAKVMIIRRDKGVAWVLDPGTKSYFRVALPNKSGAGGRFLSAPLLEKTRLGTETLDGVETTRYRVKFAKGGNGRLAGDIWVTAENIVLRVDGNVLRNQRATPFRMTLTDLKIAPQPASVFEPPTAFRLVPASHPTMGAMVKPPAPPRGDRPGER